MSVMNKVQCGHGQDSDRHERRETGRPHLADRHRGGVALATRGAPQRGASMRLRQALLVPAAAMGALVLVVGLAACGGKKTTTQAPAGTFAGKGAITLATGKDTSGYLQSALDKWNSAHP